MPKQLRQIIFKRLNFLWKYGFLSERKPEASLVADRSLILPNKKCFNDAGISKITIISAAKPF
ncbi:hypothetical protein CBW18_18000 [Pedobacter sp. AJM]|nr:hypothetical protein CBW18_18000 [Pedobacter sp. AJM]